MATLTRRPMVARPVPQTLYGLTVSPLKTMTRKVSAGKRPHSPDPNAESNVSQSKLKRAKPVDPAAAEAERATKEQRKAERESLRAEFREKYTRAFPSFVFYFDIDNLDQATVESLDRLEAAIAQLGGCVEDFFSRRVTHLVTNHTVPPEDDDKENNVKATHPLKQATARRNAVIINARSADVTSAFDLVKKATYFGMKIWNALKIASVLQCCLGSSFVLAHGSRPNPIPAAIPPNPLQRSLTQLLESERLQGATTERDPTQKRHDFHYFSPRSYFVLIEDMRGELATIAAFEYSSKGAPTWPVLHCHPHARGPFIEFDEKEEKRWEKMVKYEQAKELEKEQRAAQRRQHRETEKRLRAQPFATAAASTLVGKPRDLRRTVSLANLQPSASHEGGGRVGRFHAPQYDPINASGYLASGAVAEYTAASGNSTGIASTTGTTSTTSLTNMMRNLPPTLRGMFESHVVTSRKVATGPCQVKEQKPSVMGPPDAIPDRRIIPLRKSKSTNTLKLRREEGSKPGYCEPCREDFEEYKEHIRSHKHRKFATCQGNFLKLDAVLSHVKRRTAQRPKDMLGPTAA